MYSDILSPDSYGRYNRKLVKLTNLTCAVYWSEVLDIITKVVRKKKFDDKGFFKLDRKYIEERTGIDQISQLSCDKILKKLSVIEIDKDDENKISVNLQNMTSILVEADVSEIKKISNTVKMTREEKAASKKAGIVARLHHRVKEIDAELLDLYYKFLDAVYNKGFNTNAQIDLYQDQLNKYTSDINVKKEILKIAISRQYKECEWSINIYEKTVKSSSSHLGQQKICNQVDETTEF